MPFTPTNSANDKMKTRSKFLLLILVCIAVLAAAAGVGSVFVAPLDIGKILLGKIFGLTFAVPVNPITESIFWSIRLPRVFLAFIAGGGLAVSGVIMQSVLRNPLASSYTLGISSGAAVGASLAMILGLSFFGAFTLPFFGLSFGIATVFISVIIAAKVDKNMGSATIILTGMALSLFANSIVSFMMVWAREGAQRLVFWQMGSFAQKDWTRPAVLLPVITVGLIIAVFFSREMDIMTFGEEQAKAAGVNVQRMKWLLLGVSSVMTGCIVSLSGIIGFVDLFTPHVARRIFGSRHRLVVPASALLGGMFMVLCDLLARTVTSPAELPVGAVTSAIGAPFFIYLYFGRRRGKNA